MKEVLLPQSLKEEVLSDEHGHQGVEHTFKLVRSRCWPGLFQDIETCCRQCESCTMTKLVIEFVS